MSRLLSLLFLIVGLSSCANAPAEKSRSNADSNLSYDEQGNSLNAMDKIKHFRGSLRLLEKRLASESDVFLFDCYTFYSSDPSILVKAGESLYGEDFFSQAMAFGVRRMVFDNAYWVKTGNDVVGLKPSHDLGPIATVLNYAKSNDTQDVTELGVSKAVVSSAIQNCVEVAETHRQAVRNEYTIKQMIEADRS